MTATEWLVAAAVRATAATINAAGDELRAPFLERDMQNVLAAQLEAAIAARGLDLAVKPNHGIKLAEWPESAPSTSHCWNARPPRPPSSRSSGAPAPSTTASGTPPKMAVADGSAQMAAR